MERLKDKTILIGKEPVQGRLLIALSGSGISNAIGIPGSVPNCVSRCIPEEDVAHAKITIDQSGNMTLSNVKSQNVTYVNGSEIVSKRIILGDIIELGKDRFSVSIPMVIKIAEKLICSGTPQIESRGQIPSGSSQPSPKKFNISHLEGIWNEMQAKKKDVLAKQKKINMVRSGCGIFTMCAMPCIFLFGPIGYVLTGLGVVGNVYSFVGLKNDDSSDTMERLNEDFQLRYVCPNPDCNKFFGAVSYRLLKNQIRSHKDQKMYCPRCGCQLEE